MNCHNGEKYLINSLNSIFAQDYHNWELIFWDNKSNDGSEKIFKSYSDKRLKYYLVSEDCYRLIHYSHFWLKFDYHSSFQPGPPP